MLSAFANSFKIPELRQKIMLTLGLIFIARLGANIPLPGVDPKPLQDFMNSVTSADGGNLLAFYNMFTGGALSKGAIFALGIMPYISASIILQLMTAVVPSLSRLQQEGDVGRQKISQYTRYVTLIICVIQSVLMILALQNPNSLFAGYDEAVYGSVVIVPHLWFLLTSVVLLTSGTMLLMWLGEQITQRGIGNGISLLITIGILADLPNAIHTTYKMLFQDVGVESSIPWPIFVLLVFLLFVVTMGIVAVTQATRKIPVQYAKRVVGRKVYGGQSSFLPLKVNYSGVMPVIFASAILMFPQQIFQYIGSISEDLSFFHSFSAMLARGNVTYFVIFGLLILAFSYFWVSIMFKPIQISEDLKKYNGYIPGVRPGEPTARFLDFVMTRLTLAGAVFLTVIAIFPEVLSAAAGVPFQVSLFFGGTGMLITVGVLLDTLRQVETYLLQRHYDGFLKKGRIRGRSVGRTKALVDTGELKNLNLLWIGIAIMIVVGLSAWLFNNVL